MGFFVRAFTSSARPFRLKPVKRVVVIGAGAGGMMAAGRAAELGAEVTLLEKMERPGKKVLISGKTRCNVTNTRELDDFIAMYGPNGRFLYPAFHRFFRDDLLAFLRRYGVETKTERGGRVFPASDDAHDVVRALASYLAEYGVRLITESKVTDILVNRGRVTGVQAAAATYPAEAVVLATGGVSYPGTGSTGDGYRLAADLGHTVVKLRPALVPLVVHEIERAKSMQGVSLRNVRLTAYQCPADEIDPGLPVSDWGRGIAGKRPPSPVIESRRGEVMLTHFGLGGPVTLLMSLAIVDALENGPVSVAIDLKPALTHDQLRQRLQRDFDSYGKRGYRHLLKGLLPQKMIDPFVAMTAIPPDKPGHQLNAEERERLLHLLKSLRFNIKSPLPLSAAIVTAGGVSLKEIDPRTMASKLVEGLYFCGEVMDIDADSGGYNLQAAFSTGWVAGEEAAREAMGT
ncbi:MAG: NAD(P)/FAD-dependent oxidoreductase [Chloroflexi bacterium]|nr:NAD(P)/FAD-dependent oxidoreductase [Chloroflexota bacterium]